MAANGRAGPGVTKVRTPALVVRRHFELVALPDGVWRDIFDTADVVSEGQSQVDGEQLVYYGSTSLLLVLDALEVRAPFHDGVGGAAPSIAPASSPAGFDALAATLRADPHARLRAVRVAHREASARAGGSLGPLSAELTVRVMPRGILMTIEVVAPHRRGRVRRTIA